MIANMNYLPTMILSTDDTIPLYLPSITMWSITTISESEAVSSQLNCSIVTELVFESSTV